MEKLHLKVGEPVEVKSGAEIMVTISSTQRLNRGMRYDPEMLKYSDGRYRVEIGSIQLRRIAGPK